MKQGEYWKKRFKKMEEVQNDTSLKKNMEIQDLFDRSMCELDKKIRVWYQRLADNNGVSMVEAKKLLSTKELKEFRWSLEEYIQHAKDNELGQFEKELENASARVHIGRLEALKVQGQAEMERMFGNYTDSIDQHILDLYNNEYYHTAFEIQKGISVGSQIQALNKAKVESIIRNPWAVDEQSFSDRIWKDKKRLINTVHQSLTKMCITGDSPDTAIKEIQTTMNTTKRNASRLVMTESAVFANKARKECMENLGVQEFEVIETLDEITCSKCGSMDGKHFPMSEYAVGVTAPPFHPNCRGCTCPYFDDEFTVGEERVARNEEGKTYNVPANMTYEEWKQSFVDGNINESGLKNIIEKNTKNDRISLGAGVVPGKGNSQRYDLGQIDVKDTDLLIKELNNQIRNLEVENAIVVDKKGNVIRFKSQTQDAVEIFDVDLDGATITHNHPEANGIVSFGGDDFAFLRDNQNIRLFNCCNAQYDYSVEVLKDISQISYNMLWIEAIKKAEQYDENEDLQHIVFDILHKDGYIKYERKRKNGT